MIKTATTLQTCSSSVKGKKKKKKGIIGFTLVDKYEGKVSTRDTGVYQLIYPDLFGKWITRTLHFLPFYFSVTKTEQRATFLCQRGQPSGAFLLYLLLPRETSSPTVLNAGNLLSERKAECISCLLYLPACS